ncbi:MAG: cysteine methyltransferase [Actinomycetia bacterium]|nr:cysteine methyltransferase [Actinomycetes bacterium]
MTRTDATLHTTVDSPIGELLVTGDGHAVTGLFMQDGLRPNTVSPHSTREPDAFDTVSTQLAEYFAGARTGFDVPLAPSGSAFQLRVWSALREVPYGTTISYGELARRIGQPTASRAVGLANGRNPISVIIPCHRVIGADGNLTGYGGGIERKELLLALEGCTLRRPDPLTLGL